MRNLRMLMFTCGFPCLRVGPRPGEDYAPRVGYLHRQIMQPPPGMVVDHIDGSQRKRAGCLSQYKGVSYNREHDNWFATIYYDNKSFHLGTFASEVEAARACDRRAVEVFGEFARPNFPDEWPPDRRQQVHARWLKAHGRREGKGARARKAQKLATEKRKANSGRATRRKAPARKNAKPARARKTKSKAAPLRAPSDQRRDKPF